MSNGGSSSNSSSGNERYDFDEIGFSTQPESPVIAYCNFEEPGVNDFSYTPGPGAGELGFTTVWRASGGSRTRVGVVEAGSSSPAGISPFDPSRPQQHSRRWTCRGKAWCG